MQIAVIPARGGSKRIPRKNIRPFCGRPMIGWAIRAARDSGLFAQIVVSTDDAEIAEVARAEGADATVARPAELSDDHTPTRPVINHAIRTVEAEIGAEITTLCCIYATAAMVTPEDLRAGRDLLGEGPDPRFVFAAAAYAHPVQRAMVDGPEGLTMLFPDHARTRSQDLPEAIHDAGLFYWGRGDAFLADEPMFGPRSRPLILPRDRAVDIDTPEDWAFAERMKRLSLDASEDER